MKLEVLVSTMHRSDHSLLDEMNIQTDAVVINQCDRNELEEFEYKSHHIKWISVNERGIGKSRNLALENSSGDIVLFADDDVVYNDGFESEVISAFEENDADIIMLNFKSLNDKRPEFIVEERIALNRFNSLRYGAIRIAAKAEVLKKSNIKFSLLFGGGARYQAGEDCLFVIKCLQAGFKMIALPINAGVVKQEDSTWFKGFDEKFFNDRGALFYAMYGSSAWIYLVLMELKGFKKYDVSILKRFKAEHRGIKDYKNFEER